MPIVAFQPSPTKTWQDLYTAALMEGDANRLPSLIAEAEEAILERLRGLAIAAGNNLPEADAIEDALYALHALKTCLALHGGFARAAGPRAPLD